MQGNFPTNLAPKGAFAGFGIQDIQDTNLSPEEKLNRTRELYRETAAIRRAFMPSEKLEMERKRGREYMALKRAFMTPEEREIQNRKNRERVRLKRMYMTEEKKEAIRKMQRERLQRKRAEMTDEEKLKKREKWRVQMQEKRASFTEEEKNRLRAYNREKAREYRQRKQQYQQQVQQQGASFTGVWPPYNVYHPGFGHPSQESDQQEGIPDPPVFPTPLNMETSQTEPSADSEKEGLKSQPAASVKTEEPAETPMEKDPPEGAPSSPVPDVPTPDGSGDNSTSMADSTPKADSTPIADSTPTTEGGSTAPSTLPPSIQKPFQIVYRAVNKLRKFCQERYQTEEFERFDRATLNELLGAFYASVEQLPWMGLQMTEFVIVMREGLVCFMRDFLQMDIENDPDFEGANREFCQRLEALMEKAAASQTNVEGSTPAPSGGGPSRASPYAPPELRVDEDATQRVVAFFRTFLTSMGKSSEFESFPPEALNEVLHDFYIYAKKLPQRSLPDPYRILRLRLAHHMKVATNIDIVHDPAFELANSVCKVTSGKISLEGPRPVVLVPANNEITCEDMVTILSSEKMDPGNPQGLLNLCMFNVVFYLCRSIKHGLADLMRLMDKGTFLFEKNEKNMEHVVWQSNYVETMPEVVGHRLCPVANFKVYLSKLSPHTNTLWQHPLKKPCGSNVWYHANIPIGSRKIQLFVERLCREIGLQNPYSLSVLQNTSLQTMANALRRVKTPGSAVSLTGTAPSRGNQRRGRKRVATAGGAVPAIKTLDDLDGCLNSVDWGFVLPEWADLKKGSHCTRDIDFLKQLLEVYRHTSASDSPGENSGMNVPVVGVISATVEQSAERQERARRLDAFLASSTRSSSRRKSSVVQRRGKAGRVVDQLFKANGVAESEDNSVGAAGVSESANSLAEQSGDALLLKREEDEAGTEGVPEGSQDGGHAGGGRVGEGETDLRVVDNEHEQVYPTGSSNLDKGQQGEVSVGRQDVQESIEGDIPERTSDEEEPVRNTPADPLAEREGLDGESGMVAKEEEGDTAEGSKMQGVQEGEMKRPTQRPTHKKQNKMRKSSLGI